jgi:uncharacterized protein (DUF488 family)
MKKAIKLFTIGFTHKTAETFFSTLIRAGVRRVIDIRLNNTSQLAGFAKKDDLCYFLKAIGDMDYIHRPDFAPTQEILDGYKKKKGDWAAYELEFKGLLEERKPEAHVTGEILDLGCLLCSEPKPDRCHRRLVAERLRDKLGNMEICHL